MTLRHRLIIFSFLGLVDSAGAFAQILVDKSPDTISFVVNSNIVNSWALQWPLGEFTLTNPADIRSGAIYTNWGGNGRDQFLGTPMRVIFENSSLQEILNVQTSISVVDNFGSQSNSALKRVGASFATVSLQPGTYFFGLAGIWNPADPLSGFAASIGSSALPAPYLLRSQSPLQYRSGGATGAFSFQLYGSSLPPTGGPTLSVPESASWAMMIIGFGITGAALRRRRTLTDRPRRFAVA